MAPCSPKISKREVVGQPCAHARCLDRAQHAACRAQLQEGNVVHIDGGQFLAAGRHGPLLDQRVQGRLHRGELAEQRIEQVEHVRADVKERAAAGDGLALAPTDAACAGRYSWRDSSGRGRKRCARGSRSSTNCRARRMAGKKRKLKVICVLTPAAVGGRHHALGLRHVHGQRLLAVDVLAGRSRGFDNRRMHVVGHADVDEVDIGPGKQGVIVVGPEVAADFGGGGLRRLPGAWWPRPPGAPRRRAAHSDRGASGRPWRARARWRRSRSCRCQAIA